MDQSGQATVLKGKILEELWRDPKLQFPLERSYQGWIKHKKTYQNILHLHPFIMEVHEIFSQLNDYGEFKGNYALSLLPTTSTGSDIIVAHSRMQDPIINVVSLAANKDTKQEHHPATSKVQANCNRQ